MTFSSSLRPVSVIVATSLLLQVSLSRPVQPFTNCSINETTDPAVRGHAEQVAGGIETLITLGTHLNGTIVGIPDIHCVDLSLRMVCNMYNLYAHFTTLHAFSTILTKDNNYGLSTDFSSNQFVAWKVMLSACQWAKNNGSSLPSDCSLLSIANTCYSFSHQRLVIQDRLEMHCVVGMLPSNPNLWASRNELPTSVVDYITNVINN